MILKWDELKSKSWIRLQLQQVSTYVIYSYLSWCNEQSKYLGMDLQ